MTRLKHFLVGKNPRRTIIRAVFLAATAYFVFGYLLRPVRVQGISMQPTLMDRTIHVVNLTAYWHRNPQRGDMVAVAMPGGRVYYMKRVLALPGETISFDRGRLSIDGTEMPEPYLAGPPGNWNMNAMEVPADYYFIAGDNRNTPFEGHTLGLVESKRISGALLK